MIIPQKPFCFLLRQKEVDRDGRGGRKEVGGVEGLQDLKWDLNKPLVLLAACSPVQKCLPPASAAIITVLLAGESDSLLLVIFSTLSFKGIFTTDLILPALLSLRSFGHDFTLGAL